MSSHRGCNTQLGNVRPLCCQPGRVRPTRVQGNRIGVADREFGSSLPDSRAVGRSHPEAQERGPGGAEGASASVPAGRFSDQA